MANSLHGEILDAYETTIQGLGEELNRASGNPAQRIYKRMLLDAVWAANAMFPCVVLAPVGTESVIGGTNNQDDMSFPITVRVVDRHSNASEPVDDYLFWRETIRQAFHEQRLSGVAEVFTSLLQPSPTLEEEPLKYQILSMPLAFAVTARQARV